jgi:hypothetical protein
MTAPKMTSGMPKAEAVASFASEHGWSATYKRDTKADSTILKLVRETGKVVEVVEIRWDGNSCKEMPVANLDGQLRYVRNVAAAKRVIASTAEENEKPFQARTEAKQSLRKAATPKRVPGKTRKLPFTAESSDEEILAAIMGRKVIWEMRMAPGEYQEDVVDPDRNRNGHTYVRGTGEKRQVAFVGAYGFRAVYLDQIAAVR